MYVYDQYDQTIVDQRVVQFRDQTERFLAGKLSEAEFLPLRLQNGLYVQRLAPMLRIAVPYGLLNSTQVRKLAEITRVFDKGYAHVSTRQNIQLNWPRLEDVPDILAELASVQMHAIQTSGNCIRNTTTDQYAGVATDELEDPRPYCEIIRQWSTLHPEFAFLPRKFKIAVCGTSQDRAAIRAHDIGVELVANESGNIGCRILAGGGLGRTPVIGSVVCEWLDRKHLLTYLEAILRVYNQNGRRDNKYKARIKILVKAMGIEAFRDAVEQEWALIKDGPTTLTDEEIARAKSFFTEPPYAALDHAASQSALAAKTSDNPIFGNWVKRNTVEHRVDGYRIVNISLKATGFAPGDITDTQLELVAELADQYSFGEVRTTHQQNLVLADVQADKLYALCQRLQALGGDGAYLEDAGNVLRWTGSLADHTDRIILSSGTFDGRGYPGDGAKLSGPWLGALAGQKFSSSSQRSIRFAGNPISSAQMSYASSSWAYTVAVRRAGSIASHFFWVRNSHAQWIVSRLK